MAGRKGSQIESLETALQLANTGAWDDAHRIVQRLNETPMTCWLHAVLHKIEGDETNARYWYARCDHDFQDFKEPAPELAAIEQALGGPHTND